MKTAEIKQILLNKQFVHDIYSYCDGCCNFCGFTEKCANFYILQSDLLLNINKTNNTNALQFWQNLENNKSEILNLINNYSEKIAFDLSVNFDDNIKCKGESHSLYYKFLRIQKETKIFRENIEDLFVTKNKNSLQKHFKFFHRKAQMLDKDYFYGITDIIYWFTEQVKYKFAVAIDLRLENNRKEAILFAKISQTMLLRLINLWGIFIQNFKKYEHKFMPIVIEIYWLNISLNRIFPEIKTYKRPIFD